MKKRILYNSIMLIALYFVVRGDFYRKHIRNKYANYIICSNAYLKVYF